MPGMPGIYMYICPPWRAYILYMPAMAGIYIIYARYAGHKYSTGQICVNCGKYFIWGLVNRVIQFCIYLVLPSCIKSTIIKSFEARDRNSGTFIIYMGSRRTIYNDIAASTSVIFRPRQKNSLGPGGALGNFLASDEK